MWHATATEIDHGCHMCKGNRWSSRPIQARENILEFFFEGLADHFSERCF